MKKMQNLAKFSLILFLFLFLFFINFNVYNVNAQSDLYDTGCYTKKGDVVYFEKPASWSDSSPNIYAWNSANENIGEFPGNQMSLVEGTLYKYEFTTDTEFSKIIFSDGNNKKLKTDNLDFICSEYVYKDNLKAYAKKGDVLYFSNNYGNNTHVYLYDSITGESAKAWPGYKMEGAGYLYRYEIVDNIANNKFDTIIFNNGGNGLQTDKFAYQKSGTQYNIQNKALERTYLKKGNTIYFEKPASWDNQIYIYMWNSLGSNFEWTSNINWATDAAAMKKVSEDGNVYSYTLSDSDNITLDGFDNVIFTDGTRQTKDLSIVGEQTTFKCNEDPITDANNSGKYDGFWAYGQDKSSLNTLVSKTTLPTGDEVYYTEDSYKLYKEQFDLANLLLDTKYVAATYIDRLHKSI